jgi:hypothetical protein
MCEWAPKGSAFSLCQHFARAIKHKEGKQQATENRRVGSPKLPNFVQVP